MRIRTELKTMLTEKQVPDAVRWLQFLPRWSLTTGLVSLTLPIVFLIGIGQKASDNVLGAEFVELMQAARNPGMFRAAWGIDAIIWLMLGVVLIAAAGIIRRLSPIHATFITICGATQVLGAFGSFLRLDGISDIAARYSIISPDQHAELLGSYLNLSRVIDSSNHIAVLLQGLGFLMIFRGFFRLSGFPRWLAAWYALPGLLSMAQFGLFITGAEYLFALNVTGLIAGNIALNIASAIILWQPSKTLIFSAAGKSSDNKG
jgi:hypothetical protein